MIAALLAATGCTGTSHARPSAGRTTDVTSAHQGARRGLFTVTAAVQSSPDGRSVLCGPIQGSTAGGSQPLCAGTIRVEGLPRAVAGSRTVRGGYTLTPFLRLVGRWNAGTLSLTQLPSPMRTALSFPPSCAARAGTARASAALTRRIANDLLRLRAAGTDVYQISRCGAGVAVWVPIADTATRRVFRSRYGPAVRIVGWLRPV